MAEGGFNGGKIFNTLFTSKNNVQSREINKTPPSLILKVLTITVQQTIMPLSLLDTQ